MQAKNNPDKQNERTFTEAARRAQIVAAAIETIAELGYARSSFSQIAKRAGLSSTGLISYHFAGKQELINQVVSDIFCEIGRFMSERVGAASDARAKLRAYIEGNVEFIAAHRKEMKALWTIVLGGGLNYDAEDPGTDVSHVEEILKAGQAAGEFRAFDTRVMAGAIQRAIEGLMMLLESTPDFDTDRYARELVTLFELGTRESP